MTKSGAHGLTQRHTLVNWEYNHTSLMLLPWHPCALCDYTGLKKMYKKHQLAHSTTLVEFMTTVKLAPSAKIYFQDSKFKISNNNRRKKSGTVALFPSPKSSPKGRRSSHCATILGRVLSPTPISSMCLSQAMVHTAKGAIFQKVGGLVKWYTHRSPWMHCLVKFTSYYDWAWPPWLSPNKR